jgi:hypothetical protein
MMDNRQVKPSEKVYRSFANPKILAFLPKFVSGTLSTIFYRHIKAVDSFQLAE